MTKQEQIQFVDKLSRTISQSIAFQIRSGWIPMNWDGHELRTLLARRHQQSADMCNRSMKGKRLKDFRNHALVHNL